MALSMGELWGVILGIDQKKGQKDYGIPSPLLIEIYCLTDIGCPFFRPVRLAFGMFARQPFADRQ